MALQSNVLGLNRVGLLRGVPVTSRIHTLTNYIPAAPLHLTFIMNPVKKCTGQITQPGAEHPLNTNENPKRDASKSIEFWACGGARPKPNTAAQDGHGEQSTKDGSPIYEAGPAVV